MPRNDKSMAAVTTTIAAGVALAGLGMSAAQAVKAEKQKKEAYKAASTAAQNIANIKETNPFNAVQVPTLGFELAQQGIDRASMSALSASQSAGSEGVIGGVSNLVQGVKGAELDLSAQANEAAYNRDVAEANTQVGINQRTNDRIEGLETMRLKGAQKEAAQAQENKQTAIKGMFESATGIATGLAGVQTGAYKMSAYDKDIAKLKSLGYTDQEALQIYNSPKFKTGQY